MIVPCKFCGKELTKSKKAVGKKRKFVCRACFKMEWTTSDWKKELWKWFTLYIKKRDRYVCVTCGKPVEGADAQGGHYIAKAVCGLEYYFSEMNVHCQCTDCNLRHEGNRPAMREYILRTYGEEVLTDIEMNYHKTSQWSSVEFERRIALYKSEDVPCSAKISPFCLGVIPRQRKVGVVSCYPCKALRIDRANKERAAKRKQMKV